MSKMNNNYYGSFGFPESLKNNEVMVNKSTEHLVVEVEEREEKNDRILGLQRPEAYFLVFVVSYVVLLISGAMVFSFLEGPMETSLRVRVESVKRNFLTAHPDVTNEALEDLISEVVAASNRGVSAIKNATGESNWSFGQSFFFTSTVLTTIGYGHVTPLSRAGKIFCMAYAVVGIPLTLVLLSALVNRLMRPVVWLLQWMTARLGQVYQPFSVRLMHFTIVVSFLLVFFLLIPAAIFSRIEPEWDYMDSMYYCFISLTTVGLGDYIPGDSPNQPYRPLYKIAITGFLYVGISFLMVTLAVFYDIPQLNLGFLFVTQSENGEKRPLAGSGISMQYGGAGSNVLPDPNSDGGHRQVVRVRSRRADSPSPDEPTVGKDFIKP